MIAMVMRWIADTVKLVKVAFLEIDRSKTFWRYRRIRISYLDLSIHVEHIEYSK